MSYRKFNFPDPHGNCDCVLCGRKGLTEPVEDPGMCFTEYKIVKVDSDGGDTMVVHDLTPAEMEEFDTSNPKMATEWTSSVKNTAWWKACNKIIKILIRDRDAVAFKAPVDPIALRIPDYYNFIKHPMDFGTIDKKLNACDYQNPMEFVNDVRTVFRNCYIYNNPKSVVLQQAEELSRKFEEQLATLALIPDTLIKTVPTIGKN